MTINAYGLMIAFAILVGTVLCRQEEKSRSLPKDTGLDIVLYAIPPAIIGARLYYVLFSFDQYRDELIKIFYIWEGGLAIYGGVIGGILGLFLLSKRKRIPFLVLSDVAVPALILGQAIGRWGNFFNQEAHGYAVTNAALQFFPFAVQIEGAWYHATFFYESLWNVLSFLLLYINRKRIREMGAKGDFVLWYGILYGFARSFIESMRMDSLMLGGIRVSCLLSLLVLAICLFMLLHRRRAETGSRLLAIGVVLGMAFGIQIENLALCGLSLAMFLLLVWRLMRSYRATGEAL